VLGAPTEDAGLTVTVPHVPIAHPDARIPHMKVAAVFPGQGSFAVGCTRAWVGHDEDGVLDAVSEAAGFDIVAAGDEPGAGRDTERAQPVIFSVSLAAWRALRRGGFMPSFVAGHSLGEYSAAAAAEVLPIDGAARVVAARGAATAAACRVHPGGMAAVIKLAAAEVEELVEDIEGLVVANDNSPGQIVIAGDIDAMGAARERVDALGGRLVTLDVEGAFHSPAMAPAVEAVRRAFAGESASDPVVPLVSASRARVLQTASEAVTSLVDGILGAVRWRDVQLLLERKGVTDLVEVGPGRVLAGIAKRTVPALRVHTVDVPGAVADVLERLAGIAAARPATSA
jgi:[acyl-carrier-protein] S-malonyltransferase